MFIAEITCVSRRARLVSRSERSMMPPDSASGQPVGQGSPHGGPYLPVTKRACVRAPRHQQPQAPLTAAAAITRAAHHPLFGDPFGPNSRPSYHRPGPDSVGKPKRGGRKYL